MAYRETIVHGDTRLPLAIYHITKEHPRYRMNPHWHPEIEILAVHKGVFHLHLNDSDYSLSKGTVTLIAGGSIHAGEPENCEYTCILVNPSLLMMSGENDMSFFHCLQSRNIQILPELSKCSEEYYLLCEEMLNTWNRGGDGYPFFIKSLIFKFWGTILERKDYRTENQINPSEGQINRMKNVISYLESHYQNKVSLNELSEIADLSPNHFCKVFKQVTGFTPFSYLQHFRLEKARYALETTDLTVTEIALDCGFNDVSHFIESFRILYGKTPKQIKNRSE